MDEINQTFANITTHVSNIWDKIEEKGGTVPPKKNMTNIPAAIRSIGG